MTLLTSSRSFILTSGLALSLVLAACGGSSDDNGSSGDGDGDKSGDGDGDSGATGDGDGSGDGDGTSPGDGDGPAPGDGDAGDGDGTPPGDGDGDSMEPCEPGARVPAPDGCNTCTCNDDGTIGGCTEIACIPKCDPESEPDRRYIGTSPSQCALINYTCGDNEVPFSNDCGCGCESTESDECPAFIDCMPVVTDERCNDPKFSERCPNTEIAH